MVSGREANWLRRRRELTNLTTRMLSMNTSAVAGVTSKLRPPMFDLIGRTIELHEVDYVGALSSELR